MATKKKYKKLTNKEKEENKRIRKELRAEGVIPAIKPRLNRKKFYKEVKAEFEEFDFFKAEVNMRMAILIMMGSDYEVTSENIGVLKAIKIAMETQKFEEKMAKQGKSKYNYLEFFEEVVVPIRDL